jgi:tripartite-type tricarboxylate transporter receptor subunit TctC
MSKRLAASAAALLAVASPALGLAAEDAYPSRVLRLVVPYPPGGVTNIVARLLSDRLAAAWNQNVIVDNRPGANGITGTNIVAKATGDGYTLGLVLATHVINPLLYPDIPFDAARDFAPISMVAEYPLLLVVHAGVKATSLAEFLGVVRAQSGKFTFASSGNGSGPHLAIELLKTRAGIDLVHVPYKGGGLAIADTSAGHVSAFFSSLLTAQGMIQAGRLRVIAVSSRERAAALPNVPAIAEAFPGYSVTGWLGLIAPAGVAPARIRKVHDRLAAEAAEPRGTSPGEFAAFLAAEREKFAAIIKAGRIRIE